jgi:hypothetical protein
MRTQFDVRFNHKKQWVTVYLEHTRDNFIDRNGKPYDAYYVGEISRKPRSGKFGEVHFYEPKFCRELAYHEFLHLLIDFIRAKNGDWMLTENQEEGVVSMYWELMRAFWREYGKA